MRTLVRRYPVTAFLVLAFLLTWSVWVPRALASQDLLDSRWPVTVGAYWTHLPAVAAVLAAALVGRGALRDLGARLVRWRVRWWWYAVVLLGPAAFWAAVWALAVLLGWSDELPRPPLVEQGPVAAVPLLLVLALTDGLGEEPGWRGYALPRQLERFGALSASLFLGVVWALWHAPLFWTDGATLAGGSLWVLVVELPAVAVVFTWVFQRTGGSALLAILLHAAMNLSTVGAAVAPVRVAVLVVVLKWLLTAAVVAAWRRNSTSGA